MKGDVSMATVQKRGNSYLIKVSCGYNSKGKQVVQSKTWTPEAKMTAKQIEKELERQKVLFEQECKVGPIVSSRKFEDVAEEWFDQYAKINQAPTTYYRNLQLKSRVYDAIGYLRMDKINAMVVQKFANDLIINGKNMKNGKSLARKTIVHHISLISCVFDYAIRLGNLTFNPCRNVILPPEEQKEMQIYEIKEVEDIFNALEKAPIMWRVYIQFAIYSGFRLGELLGLTWDNINFDTNLAYVKKSEHYTPLEGSYLGKPKTQKSKRINKQSPDIMIQLRQLYDYQQERKAILGSKWQESNRLFINQYGAPLNIREPRDWFKKFCEENNIRYLRPHSLRHFHASLLITAGIDPVAVSNDMGHSQVSTTQNIYAHIFAETKQKNCDTISNALSFTNKKKYAENTSNE